MAITKDDITSNITLDNVEVKIDLSKELKGLTSEQKAAISDIVSSILLEEIKNDAINNQISSVTGKKFKGLSPDYKAIKKALGKGAKANLKLKGDMFENMRSKSTVQTAKIKITKSKQIKKFFNHNTGDTLPKRQTLPNNGEGFRSGIMKKINAIIRDAKSKK